MQCAEWGGIVRCSTCQSINWHMPGCMWNSPLSDFNLVYSAWRTVLSFHVQFVQGLWLEDSDFLKFFGWLLHRIAYEPDFCVTDWWDDIHEYRKYPLQPTWMGIGGIIMLHSTLHFTEDLLSELGPSHIQLPNWTICDGESSVQYADFHGRTLPLLF
jgi:hypothetical protein